MKIYDTTLRDGTQNKDVRLTVHDKLEILQLMDDLKIDYAELGWPGSNPKDMETFVKASRLELKHIEISAFCSTRRKNITADKDPNLLAVLESKAKTCSIFGKTWLNHVTNQLKATPEENLEIIKDSITFLKYNKLEVFFDAEHYFDAFKDNPHYAILCLKAALEAKADCIVLCDTNGGTLPNDILEIFNNTISMLEKEDHKDINFGIHCHNDSGCAVANSLILAPQLSQIQCTINGFGERTGNADLCQILPALILKHKMKLNFDLKRIRELSEKLYILSNNHPMNNQPYVGKNAFSHKGGIHVDAISKGAIYEHIDPELVGNRREIVLSDLSGAANIIESLKEFDIAADKNDLRVKKILEDVKDLEKRGYDLDLDAEKFLLLNRHYPLSSKPFDLKIIDWRIITEKRDNEEYSECILVGTLNNLQDEVVAPLKDAGPVDATFKALKKLIFPHYKEIQDVSLTNFKVMIAEDKGAESTVRVYIEFKNHKSEWATIGVSENILEASLEAVKKGFEYYILKS